MTITVPVAIADPALPLADPADRATFTTRKLEHLRWEREDLAPGALALAEASYDNALDAQGSATGAAASAVAVAANTLLAAGYAGATVWVSGSTYGLGVLTRSPANGRVYRKTTATAGGAVDPSANATDWSPVSIATPAQLVSASVVQAISGQCLALTNSTAQAAATNLALYSKQFDHATYAKGDTTVTANAVMGVDGTVSADKVIATTATGAHYILQYLGIATNVQYAMACRFKAAGITSVTMVIDDNTSSGVNVSVNLTTGVASPYNSGSGSGVVATTYYEGDGWWDVHLTGIPNPSGGATLRALIYVGIGSYTGDGTSGIYFDDLQLVTGSVVGSRVTTTSAAVARASGVVHPQRIVLPASPQADAWVRTVIANGIDTNLIDPNGQTIEDTAGPMTLDKSSGSVELQFINSSWRLV